jgi:hypothetical protein
MAYLNPTGTGELAMPRVRLTAYEVEHDLLPPLCVKCGEPATEHFVRTVRILDEPGKWCGFFAVGVVVSLMMLPPLFPLMLRRSPTVRVRVPFCAPHRVRTVRRERLLLRVLVPLWIVYVLFLDTGLVVVLVAGPAWPFLLMLLLGLSLIAVGDAGAAWLARRRGKRPEPTYNFPGVHPAFVAALLEDRARDRVSNPDRRGGRGDVRDDYDDEAV